MSAMVEIDGLRFSYRDREVLRGVTFAVRQGEIFGLLGPNGSGKSTLFRVLTTLMAPSGGRATIGGADLAREADRVRREIGVVFQAQSLDKKLTVEENLTHQGHLFGLRGPALRDRVAALLARFGLAERARERVEKLSGGLRRRVELAKGLLHGPRLLVLDEPTAGLDPSARREFWAQLEEERRAQGMTILFTTHLMEEADRCDRVAILNEGTIVAIDAPAALKASVGGDVVTIRAADVEAVRRDIEARFGPPATLLDGVVRIERPGGADLVPQIAAAFGGRLESITLGKPTLDDVFIHKTGRRLAARGA